MKRKILFFLTLLLALTLCFTACDTGNSGSSGNNGGGNNGGGNNGNVSDTDQGIEITYYLTLNSEACRATVKDGKVSFDKIPERLGYRFLGLYDLQDGGSQIVAPSGDCNIEITKPLTLYAHWSTRTYTIRFDPNGGSLAEANRFTSVLYGETLGDFPKPSKAGCEFVGWFSDPGESGTQYSVAEKVKGDKKTFDETNYAIEGDEIVLYAKWKSESFNVLFDYNNGTYQTESKDFDYGYELSAEDFPTASDDESRNLEFIGWSLYRDRFVEFKGKVTEDITIYACWREYKTVTFHYYDGRKEQRRVYRDEGEVSCPDPEDRHYYTFDGWFDKKLFSGQPIKDISFRSGVTDLYAKWIPNEYKIHFVTDTLDPGSAFTPTAQDPITLKYGSSLKTLPIPKCEGYDFIGWFDANGAQYSVGGAVDLNKQVFSEENYAIAEEGATLYARWEKKKASVVLDYNDGSGKKDTVKIDYDSALGSVSFPDADDGSKCIIGWSLDPNTLINVSGVVTGDMTLYAIWCNYKTVTVYKENGEVSEEIRVYQNKKTDCPIPEKEHYVFAGWYSSKQFTGTALTTLSYDDGVTEIYAKWTPVEYKIHFVTNSSAVLNDLIYTVESELKLPVISKDDYYFRGWCTNEDLSDAPISAISKGTSGDLTLYAKFDSHIYECKVKKPTCSEKGYTTYTCLECGYSYVGDYVDTIAHTPDGEATCTEAQTCMVCGEEISPALGHDYAAEVTKPTCTAKGYTTYTCHCGDSYTDDYVEALGHKLGADATCTEPSYCAVCGELLSSANGHIAGAEATCTTAQTCVVCGVELKPALGHKPEKATCTEDSTCAVCGEWLASASGHKPGKEATCTEAQTCTVCKEEISPALGHDHSAKVTEPTCTEQGYTTYTCTRCNHSYKEDYVDALGHTSGEDGKCLACGEDLSFSRDLAFTSNGDGTCTLVGIGSCTDTKIVIPSVHNGESVTAIAAKAFKNCSNLTSIKVPNSVKSIGSGAFSGCEGLESITLPFVGGTENQNRYIGYIFGAPMVAYNDDYVPVNLTTVVITGGTTIADFAFQYCENLTSITLPSTLTKIGQEAFYQCSGITSMTIPEGVTTIGTRAFGDCDGLEAVYVNDISKWYRISFSDASANPMKYASEFYVGGEQVTEVVFDDEITVIGSYALYNITSIQKIVVPDTVKEIKASAFAGCTGVESLTVPFVGGSATQNQFLGFVFGAPMAMYNGDYVPDGLTTVVITGGTSIANCAFQYCGNLTSITLPSTLTKIGQEAFYQCSGITSMTIPEGVTTIGTRAFGDCEGLETVYAGDISKWYRISFGDISANPMKYASTFYANGKEVTEVVFDDEITTIASYVLYNIKSIQKIVVPDTVKEIKASAFAGCTGVQSLTVPFVGGSATQNRFLGFAFGAPMAMYNDDYVPDGLTTVVITGGTSIANCAFQYCGNLTSITLPSTLTKIGQEAFYQCSGITSMTIPDGVTSIGADAFKDCDGLTTVHAGDISKWYRISFGNVWSNPMYYASEFYADGKEVIEVVFDDEITTIGSYALYNITSIRNIVVPNTVTEIKASAFAGCEGLESLTVPFVGGSATQNQFLGFVFGAPLAMYNGDYVPESLKTVEVTGGTAVPDGAFRYCKNLTSITLPDTVTKIGKEAFYQCSGITSMTIPEGVTSIGADAFKDCDGLTTVHAGDISKWYRIAFGNASANPMHYASEFYADGKEVTEVVFDDEITTIGSYALYNITSIRNIVVPNTVTEIKASAFAGCEGLESLTVPFVGGSATQNQFLGFVFGAPFAMYNGDYVPEGLKTVEVTGSASIESNAFYGCSNITVLTISEKVTSIGKGAFSGCSGLTEMTLPFIGNSSGAANAEALFGYVFGENTYTGGTKTGQRYGNYAAYYCIPDGLRSVTITGGGAVPNGAFSRCANLTEIILPDSVTGISDDAFYCCSNLERIVIPEAVTRLGNSSFVDCKNLAEIVIPDNVKSIGNNAFRGCTALMSLIIGNGVTSIDEDAFSGCASLKRIVIPDNVTSIGYKAFAGCGGLEEMTLPFVGNSRNATNEKALLGYIFGGDSYTGGTKTQQNYPDHCCYYYIPDSLQKVTVTGGALSYGAFYGCSNLTSVTLGESVTGIGNKAFGGCSGLTEFEIPNGITTISAHIFDGCSGLTDIILPEGVTTIGDYAFNGCSGLTEMILPEAVTSIGDGAFNHCSDLAMLVIPQNVTSIGSYAFGNCVRFTEITIPDSVKTIGKGAFSGCSGLTEVTLPFIGNSTGAANAEALFGYVFGENTYTGGTKTQQRYGNYAAYYCIPDGLRSVTITGGGAVSNGAFSRCANLTEIILPDSVTGISDYAFYCCSNLERIVIPEAVTRLGNSSFVDCKNLAEIVIPDNVKSIGNNAFRGCTALMSLIIGNGVTSIDEDAFSGCASLKRIVIPDNVTSIGYKAFAGCGGLEEMTLPFVGNSRNATNEKALLGYIFGGDSYTGGTKTQQNYSDHYCSYYYIPDSLQKVTVTGGALFYGAFYGCSNLTSVTLGESVTGIGNKAFYNCSGLADIQYLGTDEQWEGLSKGSDWKYGVPANKVICSDNEIGI